MNSLAGALFRSKTLFSIAAGISFLGVAPSARADFTIITQTDTELTIQFEDIPLDVPINQHGVEDLLELGSGFWRDEAQFRYFGLGGSGDDAGLPLEAGLVTPAGNLWFHETYASSDLSTPGDVTTPSGATVFGSLLANRSDEAIRDVTTAQYLLRSSYTGMGIALGSGGGSNTGFGTVTFQAVLVPEPSSAALFGIAAAGGLLVRRRAWVAR